MTPHLQPLKALQVIPHVRPGERVSVVGNGYGSCAKYPVATAVNTFPEQGDPHLFLFFSWIPPSDVNSTEAYEETANGIEC